MTKIARKHQKIFCDQTATYNLGIFGSFAAAAADYSDDPDEIQGLAAWGAGLAASLIANCPPFLEEFNGLFNLLSRQIAYIMQSGIPEYLAATEYHVGSLVSDGLGGIYVSVANTNTGNALSDETKWMLFLSSKIRETDSNFVTVASDDMTILLGATTDAYPVLVILPAASAANTGRLVVLKKLFTGGTGNVQIQVDGGGNIDGVSSKTVSSQYTTTRLVSDGSQWLIT
jgi:hypothetical protein